MQPIRSRRSRRQDFNTVPQSSVTLQEIAAGEERRLEGEEDSEARFQHPGSAPCSRDSKQPQYPDRPVRPCSQSHRKLMLTETTFLLWENIVPMPSRRTWALFITLHRVSFATHIASLLISNRDLFTMVVYSLLLLYTHALLEMKRSLGTENQEL